MIEEKHGIQGTLSELLRASGLDGKVAFDHSALSAIYTVNEISPSLAGMYVGIAVLDALEKNEGSADITTITLDELSQAQIAEARVLIAAGTNAWNLLYTLGKRGILRENGILSEGVATARLLELYTSWNKIEARRNLEQGTLPEKVLTKKARYITEGMMPGAILPLAKNAVVISEDIEAIARYFANFITIRSEEIQAVRDISNPLSDKLGLIGTQYLVEPVVGPEGNTYLTTPNYRVVYYFAGFGGYAGTIHISNERFFNKRLHDKDPALDEFVRYIRPENIFYRLLHSFTS